MCEKAVEEDPWRLCAVPDRFKTPEMCNKVVEVSPWQLKDVPDWFVTHQQKEYGMMTMIIMMMMRLLNGTRNTKNVRLKKQK